MSIHDNLCATLRALDAERMTTAEIAEHCMEAVPGATVEAIATALQQVGDEQLREAEQLRRYMRVRRAGITRVIDGGGDPDAA